MFTRIYLHIPFCHAKCPYCAFFSQPSSADEIRRYIDLVSLEISLVASNISAPAPIQSIYFGGGTPSLLEDAQIQNLLERLTDHYAVAPDAEITLEINPGTITRAKLFSFRKSGINRLSLGVQSFDDSMLAALGRIHSSQEAMDAVKNARSAGFDNIGIDLIHALPGQTAAMWRNDLERALQLALQHISVYGLTIEEGTPFANRTITESSLLPDEDLAADMFETADDLLRENGFEHYEIANYARPGFRSQHNSAYWKREGYLGLGAGAHSFLHNHEYGTRFSNVADMALYEQALRKHTLPRIDTIQLTKTDAMSEYLFLGLRMSEGIDFQDFQREFGISAISIFSNEFSKLESSGLLLSNNSGTHLTRRGMLLSNQVFNCFV